LLDRDAQRFCHVVTPKRFSPRFAGPDGRVIDLEYSRIPESIRSTYVPLFASILIRPKVQARVDAWEATHLDANVIGVQVRTWRDSPRRHRKHYRPAVRRLVRLLEAAPAAARFFVVSDDDTVVPWLSQQFGADRVLAFERTTARNRSWESVEGMVEDLIDMLLLARMEQLFASYLSTFSETAWWLGGARASVTVY
jgi:hypothetical protein